MLAPVKSNSDIDQSVNEYCCSTNRPTSDSLLNPWLTQS